MSQTTYQTGDVISVSWLNAVDELRYGLDSAARGASLLQFLQAGSGAVTNDVQTKLRELVTSEDFNNTRGTRNVGFGLHVLEDNTTGENNTAVGYNALANNTTGDVNTAVGENALSVNTTGEFNTAVGDSSLSSCTTGSDNTAVGVESLNLLTTGASNTAVGQAALKRITTASNNTGMGDQAGAVLTTGDSNTVLGASALVAGTTAAANVAVGYQAGDDVTTGANNVLVGTRAGNTLTTGSNVICLGFETEPSSATASNEVVLGNSSITLTRVRGQVVNSTLPACAATPSGTLSNVTGDGTAYTVVLATELYDRGGNFAANTFTAPVTGLYQFDTTIVYDALGAAHTAVVVNVVTTSITHPMHLINGAAARDSGNNLALSGTITLPMTQGDTATMRTTVSGGTKTVNILATTVFCVRLVA